MTQLDPVKLHLLSQDSLIPAETLRSMAEQILPGVRRQRTLQLLSMAAGVLLIVGGNIVYFRYISYWKGLDPVLTGIYALQTIIILSGPLIAFRMAKSRYAQRVARVMLEHQHCPHCGYDIHGLPPDPHDGTTVCPECGAAWNLPEADAARDGSDHRQ